MDGAESAELREQLSAALEAMREAEEQAAAKQAVLEQLHAAATPLEALNYLVFLVGESIEQPEKARRYIGLAEQQLAALNRLVGRALGFA